MLVASKVTVDPRMFDNAHLKGKRKTNLRRKIITEHIAAQPAGTIISIPDFQKIGRFSTNANTHTFIKRMVRDGVISQYESERPRKYYYAVTGAVRVSKPAMAYDPETKTVVGKPVAEVLQTTPDINGFIADMQKLGVKFSITISNEGEVKPTT